MILNLDSSKSIGTNSIPVKLLKILGLKIFHSLATMINQSFSNGIFPSKLKTAKVVPILKKGDPKVPSNYRSISLLPIFSKLYKKFLFLIYVNDLPNLSKKLKVYLFVDDTNMYCDCDTLTNLT